MMSTLRESLSTALTLLVFSVACAGLLAWAYLTTRPSIAHSEEVQKLALLAQALPPKNRVGFNNNPLQDALTLPAHPLLGLKRPGQAYVARQNGEAVAVVLEAIAPDGYSGEIKLLVGIEANGQLAGVRVTAHKETPGLGDYIEITKNNWIDQFVGKRLDAPPEAGWKVQKDGGQFDAFAGATVTPRAVVKAVHKALQYFSANKTTLLAPKGAPNVAPNAARQATSQAAPVRNLQP